MSRIEGVTPGGEVLLLSSGTARVKRTLSLIDILEAEGFELAHVSPAYYHHVHNRIAIGQPIRVYSEAKHTAHLEHRT